MAVDLGELTQDLIDKVSPPGTDLYPDSTEDDWARRLNQAFWELKLEGMLAGFEENIAARGGESIWSEGIVTPLKATLGYDDPSGFAGPDTTLPDITRELQQLVVLWAGWKVTIVQFQNLKAKFRAKAGNVEFEEETSAGVLKSLLDVMHEEIKTIMYNLSTFGVGRAAQIYDAVIERSYNLSVQEEWWIR